MLKCSRLTKAGVLVLIDYRGWLLSLITVTGLLTGCTSTQGPAVSADPLEPRLEHVEVQPKAKAVEKVQEKETIYTEGPSPRIGSTVAEVLGPDVEKTLSGESRSISINSMPLPAFVNEILGEELGLSFTLDPGVQGLSELVTLRLTEEVTPTELFRVTQRTLAAYGVAIEEQDGLLVLSLDRDASVGELPLVVSGKALPDVPQSHRPVFMFVPLTVVNNVKVITWMRKALSGKEIQFEGIPDGNAVLMHGKPSIIEQALAMIQVFDQPIMRGKFSRVVQPAYSDAVDLANDVVAVLQVEGFSATTKPPLGGVVLLPLRIGNQIAVFSSDESVLAHVEDWINVLDRRQALGVEKGVFYYELENASAEEIVETMNNLNREGGEDASAPFIADPNRNAIIFSGSGQVWTDYLETIRQLDKPTPSVLVEVMLVEVTLNDQEANGIEFLRQTEEVVFGTQGGLSLGANGLNLTFDRAGETRAVLNAFQKNSRVHIRSRPRLMVKSGSEASIDVGNEIPIITRTSQSTEDVDSPVIQDIQYRKTGVLLTIKPVVHSSGYVDIDVSQELSEAQQTSTSSIDSPSIFRRTISTTVTLQDGGSVLMGGLISSTVNNGTTGVPGFSKVPVLGRLFRNDTVFDDRTELMMLIIPYILESPDEAAKISAKALELLELR